MLSARAYVRIEPGTVYLGNAWMERSWSRLLGQTSGLIHRLDGFDWLAGMGPGVRASVDGQAIAPLELDDVEWSEFQTPFGAGLVLRQFGPRFGITSRFFLFHESPGMLRRTEILNRSPKPLAVDLAMEALPMRRPGIQVLTHGFMRRRDTAVWDTEERAAGMALLGRGLMLGIEGGGRYELFEPDPEMCALCLRQPIEAAPGTVAALPESHLAPYSGQAEEAGMAAYGDFLRMVRNLKKWEAEMAQAAADASAASETETG